MTNRARAQKIVEQLQPILEKFHLEAHIILSEEDEAASEEDENPLAPPKRRPRSKKASQAQRKVKS
jgi:hypothetical protein